MTDRYLERGKPVKVLASWRRGRVMIAPDGVLLDAFLQLQKAGPRNVLIQREDGSLVVRPFRGLRRLKEARA